MIDRKKIEQLIDENLAEKALFLVELNMNEANHIEVFLDSDEGEVAIGDCVSLSRHIESNLDRDEEDFDLNVSSAGLDLPLRIRRQYPKHKGELLKLRLEGSKEMLFRLKDVNEVGIIGTPLKKNTKAKKGTQKQYIEQEEMQMPFESIIEAKIEVVF